MPQLWTDEVGRNDGPLYGKQLTLNRSLRFGLLINIELRHLESANLLATDPVRKPTPDQSLGPLRAMRVSLFNKEADHERQ
jgi:hypothetical protein